MRIDYRNPLTIAEVFEIQAKNKNKKLVNEQLESLKKYNLSEIKNIIWISFADQDSIHNISESYNVVYLNDEKTSGNIDKGNIILTFEDNSFIFDDNNIHNTIVFYRSGYKNKILKFFINEIIAKGYLVINDPENVEKTSNKYITAKVFSEHNIPQPNYCLINKSDVSIDNQKKFKTILKNIYENPTDDSQYVCKILSGHGGTGVFLCHGKNILSVLQCIFAINSDTQILVQEKLDIKDGDIRVHVITINDEQVIVDSIMRQHNSDDFRTNQSLGNSAVQYELSQKQTKLVKDIAKISGLIWAGIDILPDKDGNNYAIEINGSAGSTVDINDPNLMEKNTEFFKKIIDTIQELCQN